jgi:hypothetical protein
VIAIYEVNIGRGWMKYDQADVLGGIVPSPGYVIQTRTRVEERKPVGSPPVKTAADIVAEIEAKLPMWRAWFPNEWSEVEIQRAHLLELVGAVKDAGRLREKYADVAEASRPHFGSDCDCSECAGAIKAAEAIREWRA